MQRTEQNRDEPMPVVPGSQMELEYAVPQRGGRRPVVVIAWGVITSLLTLVLAYISTRKGGDTITDWHAYYLIPIGAIAAGLLTGSGYAIASWVTGVRLRTALDVTVAMSLLLTYAGTQYVAWHKLDLIYLATRKPVSFWTYYQSMTPGIVWHSEGRTTSLFGLGFLRRLCEVVGFVLGGIIPLGSVSSIPYCHLCQLYMDRRVLAYLPASGPYAKVTRMSAEELNEYRQQQAELMAAAVQGAEHLEELAESGNAALFQEFIAGARGLQRTVKRLPSRLEVKLISCRHCRSATLELSMLVGKRRRQLSSTDLARDFFAGLKLG